MASNRHLGRIVALQTLYEVELRANCDDENLVLKDVLNRNMDRYSETIDDKDFIANLVLGVDKLQAELDAELQPLAPDWPIDKIARIDRVVLRMGLYELRHSKDVPPKVVINEAVELAKSFGGENSSKFINGVLGSAYRALDGDKPAAKAKSSPKKTSKKKV